MVVPGQTMCRCRFHFALTWALENIYIYIYMTMDMCMDVRLRTTQYSLGITEIPREDCFIHGTNLIVSMFETETQATYISKYRDSSTSWPSHGRTHI
jgi:hypothetical protein